MLAGYDAGARRYWLNTDTQWVSSDADCLSDAS